MSEHSKLPWKISKHASCMIESGNRSVGTVGGYTDGTEKSHLENQANAQFIVKACNSFYQMQNTLKIVQEILDLGTEGNEPYMEEVMVEVRKAIKEAS